MQVNPSIFREYDIRGRENNTEINKDSVELIAKAYGSFLLKRGIKKVVVGHDNRKTSVGLLDVAIQSLLQSGCEVIDVDQITTPMLYWAQYHLESEGGLMITASHNPVGWNGLKLALGYSYTVNTEELKEIQEIIAKEDFVKGKKGTSKKIDINQSYLRDLVSRIGKVNPFKVVVNTGNGSAGPIAPDIIKEMGCEVIAYSPDYIPNPAEVEMMEDTAAKVKEVGADFGFAFDADGDRLGLVDEKGQNIWPDRYMILLSRGMLEKKPGAKIVFDVKVSQALPEDISAHGGIPIMWKTGHSHIKEKMAEEKAELAGEMSGHIFFADDYYGFDDAIFAALKLLEYFSRHGKKISELIADTPYYISTPALHAECPDEKKYQVVEQLTEEFKKEHEVIDINGARVLFDDGWGLVRASSNLPALVLRFESKTQEGLESIEKSFREKLEQFDFVSKEWYPA